MTRSALPKLPTWSERNNVPGDRSRWFPRNRSAEDIAYAAFVAELAKPELNFVALDDFVSCYPQFIGPEASFRPLSYFAFQNLPEACDWLLRHGAVGDMIGFNGDLLPIHDAASTSQDWQGVGALRMLVDHLGPESLLAQCSFGNALHVAALANNTAACAEVFRLEPSTLRAVDRDGRTPLQSALRRRKDRPEAAVTLLHAMQAHQHALECAAGIVAQRTRPAP